MADDDTISVASSATTALRRTLFVGGILLIVSAVLEFAMPRVISLPGAAGAVVFWTGAVVFAAALVVYGFGLGRGGSIVARGPLALTAIGVLALWPLAERIVTWVVPYSDDARDFHSVWGWVAISVRLAAAIVIVVRIARAGAVRGRRRWMPLWALVAVVAPQVLAQLVLVSLGADMSQTDADGVLIFFGFGQLMAFAAPLTLGILSIVHARFIAPEPVQVYPPAAPDV